MLHLTGARHFLLPGRPTFLVKSMRSRLPTAAHRSGHARRHASGSLAGGWRPPAPPLTPKGARFSMLALFGLAGLGLLLAACGGGGGNEAASSPQAKDLPLKKLTFMAGFKPQANLPFVGVYVAQEKGFFREQGLEVDIRHAQQGEHLQLLLAGEVQVSTANAVSVLKRQAQDLDVVSVALIGQKDEQGFAVLADSGINSVQDWAGKTLGYKGTVPVEFLAIARAANLDPNKVKQVSVGFDPRILTEKRVDILPVFLSNEPDTLERLGYKVRIFDPNDYGIPLMGLAYITSRDYLDKDPDAIDRFLRAAIRGIYYANDHRDEATDIVMKYAPQEQPEHQRFMLDTELDRAITGLAKENGLGWQTKEQWQALHESLLEFKAIDKPVDVSRAFADQFVRKAFKNGRFVWP